jgi:hypothetical protein
MKINPFHSQKKSIPFTSPPIPRWPSYSPVSLPHSANSCRFPSSRTQYLPSWECTPYLPCCASYTRSSQSLPQRDPACPRSHKWGVDRPTMPRARVQPMPSWRAPSRCHTMTRSVRSWMPWTISGTSW